MTMTKVLDLNKPVQTRDGRKVRVLATDRKGAAYYPVLGLLTQADGEETVESWTLVGEFYSGDTDEADLVNVPEKIVGYLNVYGTRSQYGQTSYRLYDSRAIADAEADDMRGRIACIRVEFEEGRFDE
jgi:hypothetical protein